MKVAVIVAIWKRHDLEMIVLDRLVSQSKKFGFEIIVAGSEGEDSAALAEGCHYIEVSNDPISNKHNALVEKARELGVDGVVLLGSDDMVNDGFWKFINNMTAEETSLVGLKDLYFYSTRTKQLGYWAGYKGGTQSVGAGRFFSKAMLEKIDWKLWEDGLNSGLDGNCSERLAAAGIKETLFNMETVKAFLVDIKHTYSISNHAIVEASEPANIDALKKGIGKAAFDLISALEVKEVKEKVFGNHIVKFKSNGSYKSLRSGIYELTATNAQVLVDKGFGEIIDL